MILRTALAAVLAACMAGAAHAEMLTVRIEGVAPPTGALTVSAFADAGTFLKRPAATATVAVAGDGGKVVRIDLPPGRYAVSVIHDVNGNGVLDTNLLGIPSEPYGFSNNPSTLFGPPAFTDAAVTTGAGPVVIRLGRAE